MPRKFLDDEGSMACGQGNREIKSEDRAKTNVFAKIRGSIVGKRRIRI